MLSRIGFLWQYVGDLDHAPAWLLLVYLAVLLSVIGSGIAVFGWPLPHASDLAEFLTVLAAMVLFVTGLMRNETGSRSPDNS